MASNMMGLFKAIIIVQLFFAFSITLLVHAMPEENLTYVTAFSDVTDSIDLDTVTTDLENSMQSTLDIPVIELGALVFYSGNILIDLMLNFAFAIPEMITMILNGIMMLFSVDEFMFAYVQLFLSAVIMAIYFISLIQVLIGIRSGRGTLL